MYGPHGAPEFFTADGHRRLLRCRLGSALQLQPHRRAADRPEAGMGTHRWRGSRTASLNIHDNAYAIGAIDFTGDMPVILGPDGPSLGGFVCPATIVRADLWKIGQLRPGDRVKFHCISVEQAMAMERGIDESISFLRARRDKTPKENGAEPRTAILASRLATPASSPQVCYRQAGDKYLLVEYGPPVLDLELRFRVHALMEWLQRAGVAGVLELTPGIRSLQIHYDSRVISQRAADEVARTCRDRVAGHRSTSKCPSRIVHLPLSWDDPATRLAIEKYMQSVREDAPWCPSNIEFIRRINGLDSVEDVQRVVFDANYLVMGLGDVYLGAPVATPLDPRHRLVTTKYNPARTWTPENAVGIGGAYLCVYGMEGPGGYQFVGRTVQMWNRYRQTAEFTGGRQWLLRFFDQIRFYPVSA